MRIPNLTKDRIEEVAKEGKRFDGRKLLDYRDVQIELGISKNAEGSARVKLGDTEVVAGIKLDVGTPYTDHEEEGTFMTTVELLPMSSPKYEPGPPRIDAIEIARIVDRGIRESGFIDFKKLCIEKGEKVWTIALDIYSINDNGNLIDACALASIAALRSAKMPKYDEKTEKVKYGELTSKGMPLTKKMPITLTFYKVGDNILLDPVTEEEESSEARLSLALSDDKVVKINALQKGNETPFEEKELFEIIDLAEKKFKELEDKITKIIKE